MKKSLCIMGWCLAIVLTLPYQSAGQTQENSGQHYNQEEVDDLSPYPFTKPPEEEKTLGQKIKERLAGENEQEKTPEKKESPAEYIRFYEFEDVTFSDEKASTEEEGTDHYTLTEDIYIYKKEQYRDVTFDTYNREANEQDDELYDDQLYPSKSNMAKSDDDIYDPFLETYNIREESPPSPPVEIKSRDFYRKDYLDYYNQRRKKGNGDPFSPLNRTAEFDRAGNRAQYQTADEKYFARVDHYRALFKKDKESIHAIYKAQLLKEKKHFMRATDRTVNAEERVQREKAYDRTLEVIEDVYETELDNLQNGFDIAMKRMEKQFREQKKAGQEWPPQSRGRR